MKKIFSAVATLAILLFAGCTQDLSQDQNINVPAEGSTLTIGLADGRTYLGDLDEETGARKVYWSAGDQVAANGEASTEIVINEENKANANFTFGTTVIYPAKVLYPAEMYKDASTITVPALQAKATGSFGVDAAPMAAVADGATTPMLQHLMGVLRLRLVAGDEAHNEIIKVSVKGNAGEQMSGDFAIDYANGVLTSTGSTAAEDLVASVKVNKALSEEVTDVFVVIPAREYAQGLTITILDAQGHFMAQSTTPGQAITVDEGKIYALPQLAFNPTGTSFDIEISSAADLVAFAKAYNEGQYDDVPVTVGVTEDLNLAGVEGLEPIGCQIGDVNRYFEGYFAGNGHKILNWTSSRPLFAYTGTSSGIYDLTIDASCTLTANYTDNVAFCGALVGWHKGEMKNCHNNAGLTATGNTWANADTYIGGLAGRVVNGSIVDCSVSGDVIMDSGFKTAGDTVYFGGIAGAITNPEGLISGSYVYGDVTARGGSSYKDENNNDATINFGGIVGSVAGTCTNSHLDNATANTKTILFANYMNANLGPAEEYNGNDFRNLNVGGIAGKVAEGGHLTNCTNDSQMLLCWYNGEANGSSTDVSRYLYSGGIAGATDGEVSGCTMNGKVVNRSSCLQQAMGGVVGTAYTASTVSNCAMAGSNVQASTASKGYNGARNCRVGGVIGLNKTLNVSKLTNRAAVEVSRPNTHTTATVLLGGIFGFCDVEGTIDGNNEIVNYGTVKSSHGVPSIKYTAVGGVAGVSATNLTKVVNEGAVQSTNTAAFPTFNIAGIVGRVADEKNITITECTNKGAITNGIAATTTYVGGIVPVVDDSVTLVGCVNEGSVTNNSAATSNVNVGGITGSTSKNLSGLTNKGTITLKVPASVSNTLYAGGIVGSASADVTLDNLTNEGVVYMDITASGKNIFHYDLCLGGIIGSDRTEAAVSITNSTHSGVVEAKTSARSNGRSLAMGGIAGALTNPASSLSKCICTGVVNNLTDNNFRIDTGDAAKVLRTSGGCTWQGGIVGFVEGTADDKLLIEECTLNRTTHNPDHYRHEGFANSANRGDNGGIAGFAKYADIKNCDVTITIEGQATTDVAGLVCWLINSNLEGCTLANSTVNSANGCSYHGGFVGAAEASTISGNIMNNVAISGTSTNNGVLAAKADANSSFTNNKVSGTFFGAAITLDSKMIGTGTTTVTGTTLYTE